VCGSACRRQVVVAVVCVRVPVWHRREGDTEGMEEGVIAAAARSGARQVRVVRSACVRARGAGVQQARAE